MKVASILFAAIGMALAPLGTAQAAKLKTIASFCTEAGCTDGAIPDRKLVMDASGRLYGTTAGGGNSNLGTVFEVAPNADHSKWTLNTIYKFPVGCGLDGCEPFGNLIIDKHGNLYGTAYEGGAQGLGKVYKLSPNPHHTAWTFETIYDFGFGLAGGPSAGLTYRGASLGTPYDGKAPLYGTTVFGGLNDGGVVYALSQKHGTWAEADLYSFCSQANCADGNLPDAELLVGTDGHLFGTTLQGGTNASGVVFELAKKGSTWKQTVLHNFCEMANCADGGFTQRALTIDTSGNIYGTLGTGGAHGSGVVFRLAPKGTQSEYKVLYDFCKRDGCKDGKQPDAELFLDPHGDLYGTTISGGRNSGGTVFRLRGTSLPTLYSFCARPACVDGEQPRGGLIMDASEHLFGNTSLGGQNGEGSVFEITP